MCKYGVAWPSGLRRWFKAPVSSEAWVRIPPLPIAFGTHSALSYFVGGHLEGVVPINAASSLFSLRPYDLGFIFWDFGVWFSKGLEILIYY